MLLGASESRHAHMARTRTGRGTKGDDEMAKKKAKAAKQKRTVRLNRKTMRDLGPKESTTGDIRGGRLRSQVD